MKEWAKRAGGLLKQVAKNEEVKKRLFPILKGGAEGILTGLIRLLSRIFAVLTASQRVITHSRKYYRRPF